jgi:hypothetical protein
LTGGRDRNAGTIGSHTVIDTREDEVDESYPPIITRHPVTVTGTDVCFAQGVKAGNWVFLTGHEATDFATDLAPEVLG